jgi:molybdopterin converting factor small subunit
MMVVTVKLGSALREKAPHFVGGEAFVEIRDSSETRVVDIMMALGISEEEVNLIYRNHRLVASSAHVHDGDRVALFPPNFIHFSQFYLKRATE